MDGNLPGARPASSMTRIPVRGGEVGGGILCLGLGYSEQRRRLGSSHAG